MLGQQGGGGPDPDAYNLGDIATYVGAAAKKLNHVNMEHIAGAGAGDSYPGWGTVQVIDPSHNDGVTAELTDDLNGTISIKSTTVKDLPSVVYTSDPTGPFQIGHIGTSTKYHWKEVKVVLEGPPAGQGEPPAEITIFMEVSYPMCKADWQVQ